MKLARILAATLAVAGMSAGIEARAAPLNGAAAAALDAELQAVVATPGRELASLSVLAIRNGEVVYQRQFGHRWIDLANPANSKPADAATVFACCLLIVLIFFAMDRLLLARLARAYSSNPRGNP